MIWLSSWFTIIQKLFTSSTNPYIILRNFHSSILETINISIYQGPDFTTASHRWPRVRLIYLYVLSLITGAMSLMIYMDLDFILFGRDSNNKNVAHIRRSNFRHSNYHCCYCYCRYCCCCFLRLRTVVFCFINFIPRLYVSLVFASSVLGWFHFC